MIRVLICDDQVVVCEGLRAILSVVADIEVIGVSNDGQQALDLVDMHHPDVVMMDLKMPVMNGVQATRAIVSRFPETRVLVLTTYDMDDWVFDAIRAGAAGYLLKDTPAEDIISAIRNIAAGKKIIDPNLTGKLFDQVKVNKIVPSIEINKALSEREIDVLREIGQGLSNQEIAAKLFLSEGTVRNYVSSLLFKLKAGDRTRLAIFALKNGLVDLSEATE